MNIHEYQAKAVLREFGVPVPRGIPAFSVEEAVKAATELGSPVVVVKAQIHAGGRGKAGGTRQVAGKSGRGGKSSAKATKGKSGAEVAKKKSAAKKKSVAKKKSSARVAKKKVRRR